MKPVLLSNRARQKTLGQFMTPTIVAEFMASMFYPSSTSSCRLLDAGAGSGNLSCSFLNRYARGDFKFDSIEISAYEVDASLLPILTTNLAKYPTVKQEIILGDYIELASAKLAIDPSKKFTHAILNPPYKKITKKATVNAGLQAIGINTPNLYSAFITLAISQCAPGGQIVAIIPRSFCNGVYYQPFREFMLKHTAIRRIHLFESRRGVFKNDAVLQETIIIHLECGGTQGPVTVTTSVDDNFDNQHVDEQPFDQIVHPTALNQFIYIPNTEKSINELLPTAMYSLDEIGLTVSAGPIKTYTLKDQLRSCLNENSVPLIYPQHLRSAGVTWPLLNSKKANAIQRTASIERLYYPAGFYCLVRRISPKENKQRIIAKVLNPAVFDKQLLIGFDSNLYIFHESKHGLTEALAYGLAIFLSSTAIDNYIRQFNGLTQINKADLTWIKYPSRIMLVELGNWALTENTPSQEQIDNKLAILLDKYSSCKNLDLCYN